MMAVASKASMRGGYAGVFLMGATLVITSFTCTAPFVGTLLGSAATGGDADVGRIVIGMGVFGLTMATPFVLLSLLPGKMQAMPQAGAWMDTLKVFLGFVEVAASLKFFSNTDIVWGWEVLSREAFLILWVLIFLGAAIYLIAGAFKDKEQGGTPAVTYANEDGRWLGPMQSANGRESKSGRRLPPVERPHRYIAAAIDFYCLLF